MGWWITAAALFLLAILPLGGKVCYDEAGARVFLGVGPVRFMVYPSKRKKKKQPPAQAEAPEETPPAGADKPPETKKKEQDSSEPGKKGGSLTDFLPLVRVGLDLLRDFFGRKLRVKRLECKVILAGDDPCDLALLYGRLWAAVGNLFPRLERMLVIQKRDIQIECDFTADKTCVTALVELTITVGRLLALAVCYGARAVVEFLKIRKLQKGGADL